MTLTPMVPEQVARPAQVFHQAIHAVVAVGTGWGAACENVGLFDAESFCLRGASCHGGAKILLASRQRRKANFLGIAARNVDQRDRQAEFLAGAGKRRHPFVSGNWISTEAKPARDASARRSVRGISRKSMETLALRCISSAPAFGPLTGHLIYETNFKLKRY